MKKYEQPTLDVVELSVKENITAEPAYEVEIHDGQEVGITTHNLALYGLQRSEQA